MGCWNETCMVSNAPIIVGDPVVCQIIATSPFAKPLEAGDNVSYASQRFWRVGYSFEAQYDDYGWIEHIQENIFSKETLDFVRGHMVTREQGENSIHEPAVSSEGLTDWEMFGNWVHDARIIMGNPYYPERPQLCVGAVLIHKRVYDAMVAYGRTQIREDCADAVREALSDRSSYGELRASMAFSSLTNYESMGWHYKSPYRLDLDPAGIEAMAAKWSEAMAFEAAMFMARKQWMPTSGAGSQSEGWDILKVINTEVEALAEKRRRDCDDDEDEDDEAA
jgi:hypothetical protein